MLKFRHGVIVQLGREFEVPDRLKDVITGRGKSYIEGVETNRIADVSVQTQARLIELENSLEGSLS